MALRTANIFINKINIKFKYAFKLKYEVNAYCKHGLCRDQFLKEKKIYTSLYFFIHKNPKTYNRSEFKCLQQLRKSFCEDQQTACILKTLKKILSAL